MWWDSKTGSGDGYNGNDSLDGITTVKINRGVVVFDLGGVLIDWNPRYLYHKLFDGNDGAMESFLKTVCTQSWNEQQDAGRTFADARASLKLVHPNEAELIDAWVDRYDEMLRGPISGSIEILGELRSREVPLFALSNWSAETFPVALKRFEFLKWFRGIMISGEVRLMKPDARIFEHFLETFGIDPAHAVYIDDHTRNVEVAKTFGMHGILFTDPPALRNELVKAGLILG
jgi:2-haloacid dehalogenase